MYVDSAEITAGKYYYYMAYIADATNTSTQGTPNSAIPLSSRTTSSASARRDQMVEANPWGIKAVDEITRPENVTDLTIDSLDQAIQLTWTNPTLYTDGSTIDADNCRVIILRRENAAIDNGLLQDANAYSVGATLGSASDVTVLAILSGDTATYTDSGLTDNTVHYYYDVYVYYKGEVTGEGEPADYNYSLLPAQADANPLNLTGVTAYPTSIASLTGSYSSDADAVTLKWTWGDSTNPTLVIARSTSVISGVYPSQGRIYSVGDELADGVTIIAKYSGSGTTYVDSTATQEGSDSYYYAIYSYNTDAGIYNPTLTDVLSGMSGMTTLQAGVNMCGVSTQGTATDSDLVGYIYNATGDQTLNDSDDDGLTDYAELSGSPVTLADDPYSPAVDRSLDLVTAADIFC